MEKGSQEIEDLLVVEDNPGDVRFIEEAIKSSPICPTVHSVTTASDALDFINRRGEYADAPKPDAALLDWNLPKTTSDEVLATFNAVYPDNPVVMLTGSIPETDLVRSSESEADRFMEKPTDPEGYIEVLRSLE